MTDQYGRNIDYMRISVTDRCNLRCRYCMPEALPSVAHGEILRYEELLRICGAAVELGIVNFKITGGEPLVRRDCGAFAARLKALPGVRQVTITTNGLLLRRNLDLLQAAGIDGINISLDTLDGAKFLALTGGRGSVEEVLAAVRESAKRGLRTKINTVLLAENREEIIDLARLAETLPVDVRLIELMPMGAGGRMTRVSPEEVLGALQERWPDLRPTGEKRGNGPAHYYKSDRLQGRIGLIDAVSHSFCGCCNRVRLTSTGRLKPCLCYDASADLRALVRGGCTDEALRACMARWIWGKPRAHSFGNRSEITERKSMSQIGG